jgi:tetratricopeptide (TPR) repeat protein
VPVELEQSYDAIYERALVSIGRGDADEGIELLWRIVNRLTKLRPETLKRREELANALRTAWNSLAQTLRREKRYEEAIEASRAVADHLSGARVPERMIASVRIEQGLVEEGLAQMRQIAEETSAMVAWMDLGGEYVALDHYEEAEAAYRRARQLADSNESAAFANIALFRVYQEIGRVDDALSAWGMATVLDPDLAVHVFEVYSWLIERGELDTARRYLQREDNPARRMLYEGVIELQTGHGEEARSAWRRVVRLNPRDEQVDEVAWSEAALRLGEPEPVIALKDEAVREVVVVDEALATLFGIAHAAAGELERAKHWLGRVQDELQRGWPSTGKIEARYGELLEEVVADLEIVEALRSYFEED